MSIRFSRFGGKRGERKHSSEEGDVRNAQFTLVVEGVNANDNNNPDT